jgi:hypothetical protein
VPKLNQKDNKNIWMILTCRNRGKNNYHRVTLYCSKGSISLSCGVTLALYCLHSERCVKHGGLASLLKFSASLHSNLRRPIPRAYLFIIENKVRMIYSTMLDISKTPQLTTTQRHLPPAATSSVWAEVRSKQHRQTNLLQAHLRVRLFG